MKTRSNLAGAVPLVGALLVGELMMGALTTTGVVFAQDEPVPAPGVHDLMALSKQGLVRIEGNLQPFMANLQFVKDVIAAPRLLNERTEPKGLSR